LKILLGIFLQEEGAEDIFKTAAGHEYLREISNDSGVREVNFAT
jgi:hypothetical protein